MKAFAEKFLLRVWQRKRLLLLDERDKYERIGVAIYEMRRMIGLTVEQMATPLGWPLHKLRLIEHRGVTNNLELSEIDVLKQLAERYYLFRMLVYFDRQRTVRLSGPRPKGRYAKERL